MPIASNNATSAGELHSAGQHEHAGNGNWLSARDFAKNSRTMSVFMLDKTTRSASWKQSLVSDSRPRTRLDSLVLVRDAVEI